MDKTKEPGTARFGNFINYYSFNPPDKRLDLLPSSFFSSIYEDIHIGTPADELHILDVGSNAGALTIAAYERFTGKTLAPATRNNTIGSSGRDHHFHINSVSESDRQFKSRRTPELRMLGVDLDPNLVDRSNSTNPYPDHIAFRTADLLSPKDRDDVIDAYLTEVNLSAFTLTMCLSVTLWVHLNHGDGGLKSFLRYVSGQCRFLLIEPQPWKCYKAAVRRMRRSGCAPFEHFETLVWREAVEEAILGYLVDSCGMQLVERYGRTDWDRTVCLFRNKNVASPS